MSCGPKLQSAPLVVLDTNVVLDWLVFRDVRCDRLGRDLESRRVTWVATPPMQAEFEDVITRTALLSRIPDPVRLGAEWARRVRLVDPAPDTPHFHPRCSDPDDQKFVDLALHLHAHALVSRDRAVLRCARRARMLGLAILTPQEWTPT